MASCIVAQCTVTHSADAAAAYERTAVQLVDAARMTRSVWLKAGDQNVIGNLRELAHDTFRLERFEFGVPDVEWIWESRDGFLMVELECWRRVPAIGAG